MKGRGLGVERIVFGRNVRYFRLYLWSYRYHKPHPHEMIIEENAGAARVSIAIGRTVTMPYHIC